jgi:glycine betaine catabolism B
MKASLVRIDKHNDRTWSFWLKPERQLDYTAGQYVEITLPHSPMDERGPRRWFTLSSSPTEELLAITTKFSDDSSSFKKALKSLVVDDKIDISEPMGDFVLPKNPDTPLIFVAGGIGITPFRSMAKWLIDRQEKRRITMIYALSSSGEQVFADTFKSAHIHPDLFLSSVNSRHLLAKDILEKIPAGQQDHLIYISGPEQMVEKLDKQLRALGYPPSKIVGDFFPGYSLV